MGFRLTLHPTFLRSLHTASKIINWAGKTHYFSRVARTLKRFQSYAQLWMSHNRRHRYAHVQIQGKGVQWRGPASISILNLPRQKLDRLRARHNTLGKLTIDLTSS